MSFYILCYGCLSICTFAVQSCAKYLEKIQLESSSELEILPSPYLQSRVLAYRHSDTAL